MSYAGFPRHAAALAWDVPVIIAWVLAAGVIGVGVNWLIGPPAQIPMGPRPAGVPDIDPTGDLTVSYLEGSARQATFGKHRMRLVVVDAGGRPPGFRRAVVRPRWPWSGAQHRWIIVRANG